MCSSRLRATGLRDGVVMGHCCNFFLLHSWFTVRLGSALREFLTLCQLSLLRTDPFTRQFEVINSLDGCELGSDEGTVFLMFLLKISIVFGWLLESVSLL